MPIDPSIYRAQQPVQIQTPNPLDMITAATRIEDLRAQADQRRLAGEAARQKAIDEAQVRSVMAGVGGDVDAGIAKLYSVNPRAAASLEEQVGKARKEHVEALKTNLANQNTQLDHYLKVWGLVGDQPSLDAIRPMFAKTFPELDKVLPTEYGDGSAVQRVSDLALSRKEQLEQKQNVVKLFADGKVNEAIGQGLSQANSPEEWNQFKTGMKAMGARDEMLAMYGDFSPENKARAAQLAMTPKERADLAAKATKAPTAEEANAQYRAIVQKQMLGQPVTPEEKAWVASYEQQKTVPADAAALAASNRQAAAIGAQVAQQQRAQDFTQLQTARADIRENVDKPFSVARSGADTLRETVHAAASGNKLAGSLQSLEATMAAIKSQGLNRINTAEIGATGDAGSLWDNITSYVGKKVEGQPVPANIQKDMLAFADILDKAATKKYLEAHTAANKLYGTSIPPTYNVTPPAAAAAPKEGTEGTVNGVAAVWKTVNGKAGWYKK